eukprot:gene11930-15965_t
MITNFGGNGVAYLTFWIIYFFTLNPVSNSTNNSIVFDIKFGESVTNVVYPYCYSNSIPDELCNNYMDQLSWMIYQSFYTPTRISSTIIDYVSTRLTMVKLLKSRYNYMNYLELGADRDDLFEPASKLFDVAIGVDPAKGGNVRMTSDDYFNTLNNSTINLPLFDLIFIDGLHEANQVYRDIHNSLEWLASNGTILLHDCNPRLERVAQSVFQPGVWNGDVWKSIVAYRLQSDLDIVTIDIDTGIAVIRRQLNTQPLSKNWKDFLGFSPLSMLQYSHLKANREEFLRLKSIAEFVEWLNESDYK